MVIAHQNIFSRMGHLFKNTEQQQQQQQQKGRRRRDFSLRALLFSFHEWKEEDQKLLCVSAIYFKHKLSRWLSIYAPSTLNSGEPRWMFSRRYVYKREHKRCCKMPKEYRCRHVHQPIARVESTRLYIDTGRAGWSYNNKKKESR